MVKEGVVPRNTTANTNANANIKNEYQYWNASLITDNYFRARMHNYAESILMIIRDRVGNYVCGDQPFFDHGAQGQVRHDVLNKNKNVFLDIDIFI